MSTAIMWWITRHSLLLQVKKRTNALLLAQLLTEVCQLKNASLSMNFTTVLNHIY